MIRRHWPEYAMEAALLGLFMVAACSFAVMLLHPHSPVVGLIESRAIRQVLMGLAMGGTAVALVYSPWGKQSGAHLNPAITLTFLRLGKVAPRDAGWYAMFQVLGGVAGVSAMAIVLHPWIGDPAVNFVATVPGPAGIAVAWLTEFFISLILMSVVLFVSNTPRIARWTGLFAALLVAANISLVAPLSGMSMNPARTLASAIPSGVWTGIWIYLTAPPLAMLVAAQCYVGIRGPRAVFWAKLHHQNDKRCIFCETRRHGDDAKPADAQSRRETPAATALSTVTITPTCHEPSRDASESRSVADVTSQSHHATAVVLKRSGSRGSQPELTGEIRGLLRRRLLTSCVLGSGAWLLVLVFCSSGADSLLNAGVLGASCMSLMMGATLLIPAGGLIIWCWPAVPLIWLRIQEISLFGVSTLAMASLRYAMYDHVLDEQFPAVAAGYAVAYTAAFSGFSLYSLIVVHGVFIPNTWQQTLRMAVAMLLVVFGAELLAWRAHPQALAEHFVSPLVLNALTLILGLGTSVFGSYKIGQLSTEAMAAKRRLRELGQYRLKDLIGSGGMGEVYLAEHRLLKRPCAIKLIRPERAGDPRTLARFEREVQATAQLTHPNTIEVFDYGRTDDGTLYYVMEYLDGTSLEEMVQREGPLSPERAVHVARQLCGALVEAHARGLVHRDIKPSNVIVCQRGGIADMAKLLDFGLVRKVADGGDRELTRDGNILGTPDYMSPEQAADAAWVDARSDIYSLGCLLYFMLTGNPPFARRTMVETLVAHRQDRPAPLRLHGCDAPLELELAMQTCLAKDPGDRFAHVARLLDALDCVGFPASPSRVPLTV